MKKNPFIRAIAPVSIATLLWLGLGFSLGWYYTITYYGRVGWPMPVPEGCGALILYYFTVINAATEVQAIHWMLVFPLAGFLWAACLVWTGHRLSGVRISYSRLALYLALASVPVILPGPWLAWICGMTDLGFSWERMFRVALRRGGVSPWPSLSPLMMALSLLSISAQAWILRRQYPDLKGKNAWLHIPLAGICLTLIAVLSGLLCAWPLRAVLE